MRFARGPFWLGSISKLTRSPPASESKLTLESSPVRWKKYSRPSSAAMNPKPRSETSFLLVPVGIFELLFSKAIHANARALSRRIDDRGDHRPISGDAVTLPPEFRSFIPQITARAGRPPTGLRSLPAASAEHPGAREASRLPRPQPPPPPFRAREHPRTVGRCTGRRARADIRPT